jgi:glucosyl-3-phosphoglycerate synthase
MDHRAEAWYRRRTSHWRDWPLGQLLEDKQRRGARISVVIPARNEERTVAGVDADLTQWGPHFVTGLLGPLLAEPDVLLVKGFYARVRTEADGSVSTEGGRVTELVARPVLGLWWPHLAGVVQPLAGEANHDLAVMAAELLAVAARRRSGPHRQVPGLALEQFDRQDGQVRRRTRPVPTDERPPAGTVLAGPVGWPSMHDAAP